MRTPFINNVLQKKNAKVQQQQEYEHQKHIFLLAGNFLDTQRDGRENKKREEREQRSTMQNYLCILCTICRGCQSLVKNENALQEKLLTISVTGSHRGFAGMVPAVVSVVSVAKQ